MWKFFNTLKQAATEFIADGCMSSGAAIAYYAIFALPPLAVMVFLSLEYAGISQQQINEAIKQRLGLPSAAAQMAGGGSDNSTNNSGSNGKAPDESGKAVGESGKASDERSQAESDNGLGTLAERTRSGQAGIGTLGGVIGVVVLVFTATGLFGELQVALNRAWGVHPDPDQGGVRRFLVKRALSLGLILVLVLLLLLSMLLSSLLEEVYSFVQGAVPGQMERVVGILLDNVVTFAVATLLFAVVFKVLPDADIQWRNLWVGAASTALLFIVGKALIAWYLQRADLGSSWGGAAASMIAVLAWCYYTSLVVLYGAEFTQVWAKNHGTGFHPAAGAQRTAKSGTAKSRTAAQKADR